MSAGPGIDEPPAAGESRGFLHARPDREDRLVAGYAALAIAVHVVEAAIPLPLPGVKPGLANAVTLVVLLRHGWRIAAWVAALRVLAGSLLTGTFMAPAFWLSAAGAGASLAALALALVLPRPLRPAAVGLSVAAALAHMAAQFAVAAAWFIPHAGLARLLPPLLALALLFGIGTGLVAARLLAELSRPSAASK